MLEFIDPSNETLNYRIAQKLAMTRPQGCSNQIAKPTSQDYIAAKAVLTELAQIIATAE